MSLPSPNILYKKKSVLKPSPRVDPYSMQFMTNLHKRRMTVIMGHLMIDEIKLKNGIMWNCMNNIVTVYIDDEFKTKDIMMDILGLYPKKKKINEQMSAYANQWRFRSTCGSMRMKRIS